LERCKQWVHKMCSGIKGTLLVVRFQCDFFNFILYNIYSELTQDVFGPQGEFTNLMCVWVRLQRYKKVQNAACGAVG